MAEHKHVPIESMDFFRDFVEIGDWVWQHVVKWSPLARDTVGKQLVRAIDRVGATLVEGDGRHSDAEAAHFFTIARGSARESRFWIQRSAARSLVDEEEADVQLAKLASATRRLNSVIAFRRSSAGSRIVKETPAMYTVAVEDAYWIDNEQIVPTPNAQRPTLSQ